MRWPNYAWRVCRRSTDLVKQETKLRADAREPDFVGIHENEFIKIVDFAGFTSYARCSEFVREMPRR
jgi:hypothetical protein